MRTKKSKEDYGNDNHLQEPRDSDDDVAVDVDLLFSNNCQNNQ